MDSIYGPMVCCRARAGADRPKGYDQASFLKAIKTTEESWEISLQGEMLESGKAEGTLLGVA